MTTDSANMAPLEEESVSHYEHCASVTEEDDVGGFSEDASSGNESLGGDLGNEADSHELCDEKFYDNWEARAVDGIVDLGSINFKEVTVDVLKRLHFPDLEVAFSFYNLYAKMNGFAARRNRLRRNMNNEPTQQSFVCFREGFRRVRVEKIANRRKREPRPETRCGCEAEIRVQFHKDSGRWIITYFQEVHNHSMLDDTLTFMLPGHRTMNSAAIDQMNMMLKVGIKTPQIYASFVHTAGGFQHVPFLKKDMYNQIHKQRRLLGGDASSCLKYLESAAEKNSGMFVRYLADKEGRLVHLFWSDNCSQLDYHIFGDVLAFDATYRKNKYMCPLVIFSGVNHHNQTIVFAAALIANETQETYIWLLQQFLEAMKGKAPVCVITDGHGSMKKAIESVFPGAYHRLCAWHLIRNATSNLSNPTFTSEFRKCMLFDYEVSEFEDHWNRVVSELGLEDNEWVRDLYSRRSMWATAYIRGNFFGGFRTTSRCEGLHSMLGKFVHSRHNLKDFVEQFFRCVSQMRSREAHTDLQSVVGDLVLQSPFHSLERSAADYLTREIFMRFRPMLARACTLKVRSCTLTPNSDIYTVARYGCSSREWHVSHYPDGPYFKCSCMRMESLGIPCDHIVAVLVHLEVSEMPNCLVLPRWSKNARAQVRAFMEQGPFCWDSVVTCRNWMLNDLCREMVVLAAPALEDFVEVTRRVRKEILRLKEKHDVSMAETIENPVSSTLQGCVRNPRNARRSKRQRKGGLSQVSQGVKRCGLCREVGHNRLSCTLNKRATEFEVDDGILMEEFHNGMHSSDHNHFGMWRSQEDLLYAENDDCDEEGYNEENETCLASP